MRTLFFLIITLFSSATFALPDTLFLLRHAEKRDDINPNLSEAGKARAEHLVSMLKDKEIKHIFSTNYNRTLETVKPLSQKLGIVVTHYNPRQLTALVKQLKTLKGNTVIVGHSNTTPQLVRLLTDHDVTINEDQFDKLFVIKGGTLTQLSSNN
ncbi:phosphoglycerate mutase family protein [Pseudoalteromonas spongiae]|uniref:Phosphoglycerate mutase family protein n=1 Tax=Pseudoalteromonas spongiae TaxID=298657 RepID=A0ABU8EVC9_9GAMM